jgi:hypothetical protein
VSRTLAELTLEELEELVERTIDGRFEVWLTHLVDALDALTDENGDEFRPEFAGSLRRSLEQARLGEGTTVDAFRRRLSRSRDTEVAARRAGRRRRRLRC